MTKSSFNKFLKKNYKFIIFTTFLFCIFIFKGTYSLDPDFGWRLRAGEIYIKSGIPESDPFSYTMPAFPWVDHAWVSTYFIAYLFPIIGRLGLAVVSTLLVLSSVYLSVKRLDKPRFFKPMTKRGFGHLGNIVVLLSVSVLLPFSGIRAQMVSWLMMSLLFLWVFKTRLWKKYRVFLPVFFLVWVNLHGSFAAGLVILAFVITIRSLKKRQLQLVDFTYLFLSIAVSLLNPYGHGVIREVWSSVSDTSLRWSVAEWMPAVFMADFSMIALITLSAMLVVKYRKKFAVDELLLYALLLFQGILSRRHLPLWVLLSLPTTTKAIEQFHSEAKSFKQGISRFNKVYKYAWLGAFVILSAQVIFVVKGTLALSEEVFYPKGAVEFIKEENLPGRLFSRYGWGGYLIWRLPEKGVFVDGRMPSWHWSPTSNEQSSDAFEEYRQIVTGKTYYKDVFDKYDVEVVLWPREADRGWYDKLEEKLENFLQLFGREKGEFDFTENLKRDGWIEIYQDSNSTLYTTPTD
jgi:hypothetical protein